MSSLDLSEYLNEIKVVMAQYESNLTHKAQEVTDDIKEIQKSLNELGVEAFSYSWTEEVMGDYGEVNHVLDIGLQWTGDKVMFLFEGETSDTVLGSNRLIRVSLSKHLEDFLNEGIRSIQRKTAELN